MIRQRLVTVKTATATLTVSEFGDVIVNSSSAITITLSAPYKGLWFRVTNVNTGVVSIVYNAVTLATLKQREHFLAFANDITDWYYAKAADLMTKAEIEAVLTGDISSHTHDYAPPPIISSSAPTTETVGILGQLYIETTTPTIYYLSAIEDEDYIWNQLSGGSGGGFVMNPNHIFTNNQARDDYFVLHPEELVTGLLVSVGEGFHQWNGTLWVSKTAILTGPEGPEGPEGPLGPVGPEQPRPTDIQYYSDGFIVIFADETTGNYSWIRDGQGRITNITRMDTDPNQIMTVGYNSGPRP